MKVFRCAALFAALLLPLASFAQTKNFNRTIEFAPGGELRVNTDVGTLRLTAWERNQVEVVARIIARTNENTPCRSCATRGRKDEHRNHGRRWQPVDDQGELRREKLERLESYVAAHRVGGSRAAPTQPHA